jgi:outer membrane protein assembly complex protein YaeT
MAVCPGVSGTDTTAQPEASLFGRPIHAIEYVADAPVERSHYDPVIGLAPSDILTRTAVKQAIQGLYDTGRFASVAVEASAHAAGAILRFKLGFNYYFNRFAIDGEVDLDGRAPWEIMSLPVGERFTAARLEEARRAVLAFMRDQGYYLAVVEFRTTANERYRQVDTTFKVQPGRLARVRSVEIRGVPDSEVAHVRGELAFRQGSDYDRRRLRRRLENLKESFVDRGYLAAAPEISEEFRPEDNSVGLTLTITNFGRVRVVVDGFKIAKDRLRRLLPVLSGEGLQPDLLEEGASNLKEHLEELGYPEADVTYGEETDRSGGRVLRYAIEPGRKVTVTFVRFVGNEAISSADLLGVLQIQPARFLQRSVYSVAKLDADVESVRTLYHSRGFLNAEIIPLIEPVKGVEKLGITFECDEGPLSRAASVSLSGNSTLPVEFLKARMQLVAGGPYSPHLAERDRQSLLAAYNDAGFLQARVSYRAGPPDATFSYSVEFEISEGIQSHVAEVVVLGNERTRGSVLQKRIRLEADAPLSLGKMLETQQALYSLGVFDLVRVAPQNPESIAPFQNVVVRVQEARELTLRYGIGYQERERLRGTLELSHLNIFGTGQRADLRLRGSRLEQAAALSFEQPQIRFLPVNSYFSISGRKKREVSFDVKRFNASYQYSHQLNTHSWGLFRYNFQNVRVSTPLPEPDRENEPRNLSTISAIYINDTRDNYLDPEKGFFTSTDLSLTTKLLGSRNYYSLFTQNSYYQRLGSLLFAGSLRFGAAHTFDDDRDLPLSERYFAGGGSSLRGFETDHAGPIDPLTNQPRGGNALLIGNFELRAPLLRFVHIAGFYDVGNVFRGLRSMHLDDFSHSVGAGIRIRTPFGPLRADYGFNLNLPASLQALGFSRKHFFVTIGPPF